MFERNLAFKMNKAMKALGRGKVRQMPSQLSLTPNYYEELAWRILLSVCARLRMEETLVSGFRFDSTSHPR